MAYRKAKPFGVKPPVGVVLDGNDPINRGLVGFWPLNEGGGNVVKDIARQRSCNMLGGPTWTASAHRRPFGKVLTLDGSNDYLDAGSTFDFSAGKEFSLVCWALLTAANQTDGAGLICCGNGSGGEQYNIDLRDIALDGCFRFFTRDSGGSVRITSTAFGTAISKTSWQLVVGTFSGRNLRQRIWLDGQLAASAAISSSLQGVGGHITSIGARQSGSGSYDLAVNGRVAAPRIYNRELTQADILRIWTDPFAGVAAPSRRVTGANTASAPTLTAASAINIGSTYATPRVTFSR